MLRQNWYWLGRHVSPRRGQRALKRWFQRARRGYSTEDTWSLQYFLGPLIEGAVRELGSRELSHPMDLTMEEWQDILQKIADGFALQHHHEEECTRDVPVADQLAIDEAWDLFRYWFAGLWD